MWTRILTGARDFDVFDLVAVNDHGTLIWCGWRCRDPTSWGPRRDIRLRTDRLYHPQFELKGLMGSARRPGTQSPFHGADSAVSSAMALSITAAFDGGNIRVVSIDGDVIALEIARDHQSDFYQWFSFRVAGARGRTLWLRIVNAGAAAYKNGWLSYNVRTSTDRRTWRMTPTRYVDGVPRVRLVRGRPNSFGSPISSRSRWIGTMPWWRASPLCLASRTTSSANRSTVMRSTA